MKPERHSLELIGALEDAGYEPRSYSGRGMFGRTCVSVSGDISIWEIARNIDQDIHIPNPSTDSMGLGTVLYWPTYPWPEETDNE